MKDEKKIHRESGVSEPVKTEGGFGHDAFSYEIFDAVARQGSPPRGGGSFNEKVTPPPP